MHQAACYPQAQASPAFALSGKKRLKEMAALSRRNPRAGIGYADAHSRRAASPIMRPVDMQDQPSFAAHRLHGVDDQVRKHLAQLSGKGADSPAVFKAALHFYRVGFQLVPIELEHVFQHGGDLNRLRARSMSAKT